MIEKGYETYFQWSNIFSMTEDNSDSFCGDKKKRKKDDTSAISEKKKNDPCPVIENNTDTFICDFCEISS